MRYLKILFSIFLFFIIFNKPALAVGNGRFSVSYDIKYIVQETGMTTVNQTVILKNLTSNYYATEYSSKIVDEKIANIRGFDALGPLKTEVVSSNLKVLFNDKVYGLGKTYRWTLSYETPELAKKSGRIWEIILPKPSETEDIEDYSISLSVPKEFGQPAYLKPQPKAGFTWTKDEIKTSGIFAAFGDFQNYNFRLTYNLENTKVIPGQTEIALPPTTSYQEIYLQSLNPEPKDVTIDQDGNWLAQYDLKPREQKSVVLTGTALVYYQPRYKEEITNLIDLISPRKYWESEDPQILSQAANLKTAREIYDYTVAGLSYDSAKINKDNIRLGALNVLNNPKSAICMEFTDLFVTLARANKIPAREIEGFALTTNENRQPVALKKDILHAWPEYYDSALGVWTMVDPTWGHTTGGIDYFNQFDFNHLIFAIHGMDSTYPLSAGAYKGDNDTKDVLVSFGIEKPTDTENLELTLSGTNLTVTNKGPTLVKVQDTNLDLGFDKIPPFGKRVVALHIDSPNIILGGQRIIEVKINDRTKNFTVNFANRLPGILGFAAIITTGIWLVTKKLRHLPLF